MPCCDIMSWPVMWHHIMFMVILCHHEKSWWHKINSTGVTSYHVACWSVSSLCALCPTGNKVDKVSSLPETLTSVPSSPSSLWITERAATASNTLAESVYKSFTSSSLLRVLMHTTQPMFTGKMKHQRIIYILQCKEYDFHFLLKVAMNL